MLERWSVVNVHFVYMSGRAEAQAPETDDDDEGGDDEGDDDGDEWQWLRFWEDADKDRESGI